MNSFPIEIKKSPFGRGVFSTRRIQKGDLIEVCHVLPISPSSHQKLYGTGMDSYVYTWIGPKQSSTTPMEKWTAAALVFGYAMIYNHSFTPNAEWEPNVIDRTLTFRAVKIIRAGEEIFHDYGWPEWKYLLEGIPLVTTPTP